MKISDSINLFLALILVLFNSCKQNESDVLDGTWKIVKAESEFVSKNDMFLYDGIQPMEIMFWEPLYWTFFKDSIMQSHYPNFAQYFRKYKITSEDSILNSYYDDEVFSKRFSGDTLILKRHGPKYFETFYFIKQDVDVEQIELLKTKKVDWSFYREKWKFKDFIESGGAECNPNFPEILDLTELNSKSYQFDGNILKYWVNDTLHQFQFSTSFNNEISFKYVDDSGCEYQWADYIKL